MRSPAPPRTRAPRITLRLERCGLGSGVAPPTADPPSRAEGPAALQSAREPCFLRPLSDPQHADRILTTWGRRPQRGPHSTFTRWQTLQPSRAVSPLQ